MAIGLFDGLKERFEGEPLEKILCKGLNMPFNNCNSSTRKGMYSIHSDHKVQIKGATVPFLNTPYPNQFGEYNSSRIVSDEDYEVIAKIPKFKHIPDMNYILVVKSNNKFDVLERKMYKQTTEANGYLYNTEYMDNLVVGSTIHQGDIVRKAKNIDQFGNKCDGRDLLSAFMNISPTTEDGILLCEDLRDEFTTVQFHPIQNTVNDNDIPLNLYGDDNVYKICPNVGEFVKDGILCAFRVKKEREKFYSLSMDRLKRPMISDKKKICKGGGMVVDIDIQCNNPELLYTYYNQQLLDIYTEQMQFSKNIVNTLKPLIENYKELCTDALKDLYLYHYKVVEGRKFVNSKDKVPSFCILNFMVYQEKELDIGDKITTRYGGKGVISAFLPREAMPLLDNGQRLDCIINSATMPGRLNNGYTMEMTTNYSTARTIEYINSGMCPPEQELETYLGVMNLICPSEADELALYLDQMTMEEQAQYLEICLRNYPCMHISLEPIAGSFGIDQLDKIYKACPWIKPYKTQVVMTDSNGNPRQLEARRTLVAGYIYFYRLKQHAEDKFSTTSFSPTNITGENSRSKANKMYETPYPKTPVNFGNMEIGDFSHMDCAVVIEMLLLYSTSPEARHLCEELSTGDPFDCDIVVHDDCKNRAAEKLEARLKAMGYRIVFEKRKKKYKSPVVFVPVEFDKPDMDKITKAAVVFDSGLIMPVDFGKRPDGLYNPVEFDIVKFGRDGYNYDNDDNE